MLALDLGDRLQVGRRTPPRPPPARRPRAAARPRPEEKWRSAPSTVVVASSSAHARLQPRAAAARACSTPSVFSSVSRYSLSRSPVANARTCSRYARAVGLDHPLDRLVRQRLGEAQQRQAGRHPPQVPGEVAEVGLVEVVDVEHEDPGRVHVGAEVLGVQVALDPDAATCARPPTGPRAAPRRRRTAARCRGRRRTATPPSCGTCAGRPARRPRSGRRTRRRARRRSPRRARRCRWRARRASSRRGSLQTMRPPCERERGEHREARRRRAPRSRPRR